MKNKVASVQWDPEDIFGLHLFTCNGQYIKYKLGQTVNYCNFGLDYNASIGVIDNSNQYFIYLFYFVNGRVITQVSPSVK